MTDSQNPQLIANWIHDRIAVRPRGAVVLGSGLGAFADHLSDTVTIPYREIPDYPQPTVEGHAGEFIFGQMEGLPLVVAKGRFHYYESHDLKTITLPIHVFHHLGCEWCILTNAAGSANAGLPPGNLLLIDSHLDGTFRRSAADPKPVKGPPVYSETLLKRGEQIAQSLHVGLHRGTYCWTTGPAYETPAEIQYFRSLGADAVGMSTVPELLAAADLKLPALALSTLTNFAAGISDQPLTHEEVIETADRVKEDVLQFLSGLVRMLGKTPG